MPWSSDISIIMSHVSDTEWLAPDRVRHARVPLSKQPHHATVPTIRLAEDPVLAGPGVAKRAQRFREDRPNSDPKPHPKHNP